MRMEQENDRVKLIRLWRDGEPLGERVRKPKSRADETAPVLNGRAARRGEARRWAEAVADAATRQVSGGRPRGEAQAER